MTILWVALLCWNSPSWAQRSDPGHLQRKPVPQIDPGPTPKTPPSTGKVSLDTFSPATVTLEQGGPEVMAEIIGTHLNNVIRVEVLSGNAVLPGVAVKLNPVSPTLLRLALKAGKDARPGDYLLRLVVAGESVGLPARSARVKVVAPVKQALPIPPPIVPQLQKGQPGSTSSTESFQPIEIKVPTLRVIGKPGGPPPIGSASAVFQPVTIKLNGLKVIGLPGGPPPTPSATGPFVPVTIELSGLKIIGKPGGPPPQPSSTGPFIPVTINVKTLKVIGK